LSRSACPAVVSSLCAAFPVSAQSNSQLFSLIEIRISC
jgi:hypothetical protein